LASSINASTTAGVVTTADTSGVLNIQTAGTTAIAISAAQAVSFTNPITGALNGTVGATTPSTGAFTTLSSTVTGASAITSTVDTGWAFLDGKTSGGGDRLLIQGYSAGTGTKLASYNSSLGAFAPIKIAGSQVLLAPSDTTVATVNAFGIGIGSATPSSGIGIAFPATQLASSNANTLDDYEEGTWTPNLTGDGGGSGQTYTAQTGTYTKVGRVVTVGFYINLSAKGTITGNVIISNLPFTVLNSGSIVYGGALPYWLALAVNHNVIGIYANTNSTNIYFWGSTGTASTPPILTTTDIANTTRFWGSVTYMTA